ncbi:MAG: hypothetical protein MZV49_07025 [Rhodopseudomonas palustris]|nr:hypothetical protein [Rhodopseudomonas palustris]
MEPLEEFHLFRIDMFVEHTDDRQGRSLPDRFPLGCDSAPARPPQSTRACFGGPSHQNRDGVSRQPGLLGDCAEVPLRSDAIGDPLQLVLR